MLMSIDCLIRVCVGQIALYSAATSWRSACFSADLSDLIFFCRNSIAALAVSLDGTILVSGSEVFYASCAYKSFSRVVQDKTCRVWDISSGQMIHVYEHDGLFTRIIFVAISSNYCCVIAGPVTNVVFAHPSLLKESVLHPISFLHISILIRRVGFTGAPFAADVHF